MLDPGEWIQPGSNKTFWFSITAPTTPGSYNFKWQMVREGYAWFGEPSPNVLIAVTAPVDSSPPIMWVDRPVVGEEVSGTSAPFSGWAIDASGIDRVEVRIDGQLATGGAGSPIVGLLYGSPRADVCSVHAGIVDPGCPNVGWSATLGPAVLAGGTHTFEVRAFDLAGNQSSATRQLTVPGGAGRSLQLTFKGLEVVHGDALAFSMLAPAFRNFRFDVCNLGTESLTISNTSVFGLAFSRVQIAPQLLWAGQCGDMKVGFSRTTAGVYSGAFELATPKRVLCVWTSPSQCRATACRHSRMSVQRRCRQDRSLVYVSVGKL